MQHLMTIWFVWKSGMLEKANFDLLHYLGELREKNFPPIFIKNLFEQNILKGHECCLEQVKPCLVRKGENRRSLQHSFQTISSNMKLFCSDHRWSVEGREAYICFHRAAQDCIRMMPKLLQDSITSLGIHCKEFCASVGPKRRQIKPFQLFVNNYSCSEGSLSCSHREYQILNL